LAEGLLHPTPARAESLWVHMRALDALEAVCVFIFLFFFLLPYSLSLLNDFLKKNARIFYLIVDVSGLFMFCFDVLYLKT
jgi:hypothetical protein